MFCDTAAGRPITFEGDAAIREKATGSLLLHDDDELAEISGSRVVKRTTIHEWPLSCVQRVELEDGRRLVYKAQAGPTVEAEFYSVARSPLLLDVEVLYDDGDHSCLLMEWVEAGQFKDLALKESDAASAASILVDAIQGIESARGIKNGLPDLPSFLDIRTSAKWQAVAAETFDYVHRLRLENRLPKVNEADVRLLEEKASCPSVLRLFEGRVGLVHADLMSENVLVLPATPGAGNKDSTGDNGGHRLGSRLKVIDWQRPIFGPAVLDLAILLETLGFDAARHVGPGAVWLRKLLLVQWYAACSLSWVPAASRILERFIVETAAARHG